MRIPSDRAARNMPLARQAQTGQAVHIFSKLGHSTAPNKADLMSENQAAAEAVTQQMPAVTPAMLAATNLA